MAFDRGFVATPIPPRAWRHVANGGIEASPERRGNVGSGREPGRLPTLGIYDDVNVGRTRDTTARPTLTRAQT